MKLNIHRAIIQQLDSFRFRNMIPNIIFYGPSGCGKGTIVSNFIDEIYENSKDKIKNFVMHVNCAHGKGIKFIREELKFFAKINTNDIYFKTVVLKNADKLTIDAQSALRRCIELYNHTTRFFIIVEVFRRACVNDGVFQVGCWRITWRIINLTMRRHHVF